MSEVEYQVVKSAGFVVALLLAIGLQSARPHAGLRGSWRVNMVLWALNAIILGIVCAGCACAVSSWAATREIGLLNQFDVHPGIGFAVTLLGMDLVSYAWHRANHRLEWLWRFHQVHHSDPSFTATTALRFHFGELLLALPLRLMAVALLGVSIPGVIAFELIFAFANFFEHGDIDLPCSFEKAMATTIITPALHRRHHSRESELLNSNYGTIFSIWDRVFGSYGPSASEDQVEIGLPELKHDLGPMDAIMLPTRGVFLGR